jgi:formamidopyrimidine-DNA glycosylase
MPELPEVETWRRLAESRALGKRILHVRCQDDRKVFDRNAPRTVSRALKGRTLSGTDRRGKHMWLTFDEPGHLYLHFGMTGSLWALGAAEPAPSHIKWECTFEDGSRLLYRNLRRIGKVRWLPDATAVPPVCKLGPDPLRDPAFTVGFLTRQLATRKATLKGCLLDQSIFAGVGNWIADEVLYQTRLSPYRRGSDLSAAEIRQVHRHLQRILTKAVEVGADSSRFPRTWLFHHRWGKQAEFTARGEPIRFDQVAGRTTAWVPSRQDLDSASA